MYRFNKISGYRDVIDKNSFQSNMGILGLTSVEGFSDRLFNSFDIDSDGKVYVWVIVDWIPGFCGIYGSAETCQLEK